MTLMFLLFVTGLFAGTVDAIAGGGGLISLPVLLSLGIPPHVAFGTSKLQGIVGTFSAAKRFYQQGFISLSEIRLGLMLGLAGSVSGAIAAQLLSTALLHKIIPILLCGVLTYTVVSPRLGMEEQQPRMSAAWFYAIFGFVFGFYDGFFGPGVGSLWIFFLTFFLGSHLLMATAYTKAFNLNSSVVATVCFIIGGNVDYRIAACMAAGQMIGGQLGANLAIRNGAQLIRPFYLAIVTITLAVLLYRSYAPVALWILARNHETVSSIALGALLMISVLLIIRRRRKHSLHE